MRLTVSYLAVFTSVVALLSFVAYALVDANYRSIVSPALDTPEGRAGFAAAMWPAAAAIISCDAVLLLTVGTASYLLARSALRPLATAREREERFAGDIAHELRTPLAAIASLAETAALDADEPARAIFERIELRARDGGRLISDLLTLARPNGEEALDRELVDLADIVRDVCSDVVTRNDVKLDVRVQSVTVLGDERRLRQLVRNLVENSDRYARSHITLRLTGDERWAYMSIEDDGDGVAADVEDRLFERFAKSGTSKGNGLGLAIARWVARAHSGEIVHEGGSRFLATVPRAPH